VVQCILRIKRSDWWRLNRLVSASNVSREFRGYVGGIGVRFLTIGTCFLAATIYDDSVSIATAVRACIRTLTAVRLVVEGTRSFWPFDVVGAKIDLAYNAQTLVRKPLAPSTSSKNPLPDIININMIGGEQNTLMQEMNEYGCGSEL
jgi:hypothetical protein